MYDNYVLTRHLLVIRACIAMQYPPRRRTDINGNLLDGAKVGATILETVPPREVRNQCAYDLVHFDLDTQNSKDQALNGFPEILA